MSKHQKTDGTITVTGNNGRITGNIANAALNGPPATATIQPFETKTDFTIRYGKYILEDTGMCAIVAWTHNPNKHREKGKRIGYLTWFPGEVRRNPDGSYEDKSNINGGVIHKVYVSKLYRRKGLASAMLEYARTQYPEKEIRHSNALSENGASWAANHP